MAKFPDDAVDFAKDLERLGIRYQSVEAIAGTIGYSTSHVSNLLGGGKPYAPGARTKIGEMIAADARDFEEVDVSGLTSPHPVKQAEDDHWTAQKSVDPRIYKIFRDPDGRAVVTKVLARFTSTADADEYVLFLNSQIRHGTEAG